MAYLKDLILEVELKGNPDLDRVFNNILKEVFSKNYRKKVEASLGKGIKLREGINKNPNVMAWVVGTTIYINKEVFQSKSSQEQAATLMHEFFHVLNNSKSFLLLNKFPEINKLSKSLWKIIKQHTKDPGLFLTGGSIPKQYLNYQEALSYVMTGKLKWSRISAIGKNLFISEIKQSGVFALNSQFWSKRL